MKEEKQKWKHEPQNELKNINIIIGGKYDRCIIKIFGQQHSVFPDWGVFPLVLGIFSSMGLKMG